MVKGALALARAFEGGGHGLDDRCQLARGKRDEGHARAVGVPRAPRAIAITVQGRSVGALEAVVLADDPFLHRRSMFLSSSLGVAEGAATGVRALPTG